MCECARFYVLYSVSESSERKGKKARAHVRTRMWVYTHAFEHVYECLGLGLGLNFIPTNLNRLHLSPTSQKYECLYCEKTYELTRQPDCLDG
jgi:hypothetical protein